MADTNLFLKADEAKFLAMAVMSMLEQVTESSQKQSIPWNPEARRYFKEMREAGTALKIKLIKIGIPVDDLPDYEEGDENDFITKES